MTDEPSDEVAVVTESQPMPPRKTKENTPGETKAADKASEKSPMKFLQWCVAVVLLFIISFVSAKAVRDDMAFTDHRRIERERDMNNRTEQEENRKAMRAVGEEVRAMNREIGAKLDKLIEVQSRRDTED